jgi:hypothetical protein
MSNLVQNGFQGDETDKSSWDDSNDNGKWDGDKRGDDFYSASKIKEDEYNYHQPSNEPGASDWSSSKVDDKPADDWNTAKKEPSTSDWNEEWSPVEEKVETRVEKREDAWDTW